MVYVTIALSFALAGGFIGRLKGSSFWLWFLISGLFPVIGLVVAIAYRYDSEEPQRLCPTCGHVCMVHDATCTRCGGELDYPAEDEMLPRYTRA